MSKKNEVKKTRKALKLSQVEFAQLLGVHPMTVSKWELGKLEPNSFQLAFIFEFHENYMMGYYNQLSISILLKIRSISDVYRELLI